MGIIRSIWDNTFYNTPPALNWTYKINFTDFVEYHSNTDNLEITKEDMETLNNAAVSISIGQRKINKTELFYGGLSFQKITRVENSGDFSIKFNENSSYDVTNVLEKLYYFYGNDKGYFKINSDINIPYSRNSEHTGNSGVNGNHNIIQVIIFNPEVGLDENKEPYRYKEYKFHNCKFLGVENIDYNYDSPDSITRTGLFVYDWMEYNPTLTEGNN